MYETSKFNPNSMWEKHWDEHFNTEFYKDYKSDIKNIKETLFTIKSYIKLLEKDIQNTEDKNNAISKK